MAGDYVKKLPDDLMAVVGDQGLTDAARVIAVRLYHAGDDWHELSPDDFSRMVAGYPQRDTIRKHLRQLEMAGYVDRKAGGRGHSDCFRFVFSVRGESQAKNEPEDSAGAESQPKPFSAGAESDSKAAVVEVVGDVEDNPPISPLLLPDRVERAIEGAGDKLQGCRDALRDYVRDRVPGEPRQYSYVQTVVGWIDGTEPAVWRRPDGTSAPTDRRTAVLAAALNELAASDESTFKRPVGEPANLKTKINILLKQEANHGRRDDGRPASEGRGQATGTHGPGADYDHLGG